MSVDRVDTVTALAEIAGPGPRQFAYSANHPASPLALAWDVAGPVLVTDNLRADIAHAVSKKMLQRAYALGLISTEHGLQADVHQTMSGMFADENHAADYLVRWIETGCQWHVGIKRDAMDARAEREHYAELEELEQLEQEEPTDTGDELDVWARELSDSAPAWWVEWASRLVYVPKFEYLVRLGAHAWLGAGEPRDPGTDWSAKMRRQWARRSTRCERVVP